MQRTKYLRLFFGVVLLSSLLSTLRHFTDLPITAIGWALPLFLATILTIRNGRFSGVIYWWIPWVVFSGISALYFLHENAVQRYLIMVTPIACATAVSGFSMTRDDYVWIIRWIRWASVALFLVALVVWLVARPDDVILLAPESIMAVAFLVIIAVDLAYKGRGMGWAVIALLALIPVMTVARAAFATLALALCVFLVYRYRLRGWLLGAALAGAFLAYFATFGFMDKMLFDPEAGIAIENIRTSGRSVAWGLLLGGIEEELAWGHGSNASEAVLLGYSEHFKHPHSDWLRILYDYGIAGTALFAIGLLSTVRRVWNRVDTVDTEYRSLAVIAILLSMCFGVLMITDNVLLYAAFFGNVHMFITGAVLASRNSTTSPTSTSGSRV